jgi:3-oxoacyl-[acyl-carrier protein] reductase
MKLQDRVALVTGGGGHLGRAIVQRLAEEGASLTVNDRDLDAAQAIAQSIVEKGGRAVADGSDITKTTEVNEMTTRAIKRWGGLDILVNNAGGPRDALVTKMSDEDWDFVLDLNLKASFLCARAVVPQMIGQGYGRIVNISSTAYTGKNSGQVNYASAKAGVIGLTRALGLEVARHGITVNCVVPGLIDTPKTCAYKESILDRIIEGIPMGKMGKIGDIAAAVLFLCSEESKFITREVLHVSGGVV